MEKYYIEFNGTNWEIWSSNMEFKNPFSTLEVALTLLHAKFDATPSEIKIDPRNVEDPEILKRIEVFSLLKYADKHGL